VVEPLPEVQAAFKEFEYLLEEPGDLPGQLAAIGNVAQGLVPSTVGVSLSIVVDEDTFTLTSTAAEASLVDAAQYLEQAGPCLAAVEAGENVLVEDVLDEDRWQLYRHSSTTVGIRSSLSLPLRDDSDRIAGALNIYATEPGAFHGREEIFAAVFGAKVSELVKNADLTFQTREWARQLPDRVSARRKLETAVGVLMALRGWPPDEARTKLREAAEKAGIEVERVAEVVMELAA
jgi:GAF domain-containing protein